MSSSNIVLDGQMRRRYDQLLCLAVPSIILPRVSRRPVHELRPHASMFVIDFGFCLGRLWTYTVQKFPLILSFLSFDGFVVFTAGRQLFDPTIGFLTFCVLG